MDLKPINWEIVKHPMNWIIILLMLVIAGAIGHYTLSLFQVEPSTAGSNRKSKSSYGNVPQGQVPADDVISAINPTAAGYTT